MTTKSEQGPQVSTASSSNGEPSRRTILVSGAALSVSALAIASPLLARHSSPAETAILKIARNREAAIGLGKAAHESWPQMRNRSTLLIQILDDLQLDAAAAIQAPTAELARRLSRRIRMDFATARTVNLDGWVLSLAEVRFYALAAFGQMSDRPS
jgi:hypothetical protein